LSIKNLKGKALISAVNRKMNSKEHSMSDLTKSLNLSKSYVSIFMNGRKDGYPKYSVVDLKQYKPKHR